MHKYELNAFFVYNGFVVEKQHTENKTVFFDQTLLDNFVLNKYKTLLEFGFFPRSDDYTPTIAFLHSIAKTFIEHIAADPNIENTRCAPVLNRVAVANLLATLPFSTGSEFVDKSWLKHILLGLSAVFESELFEQNYTTVADYLISKKEKIRPTGCIYFHMVESSIDGFPFAFLATYSTKSKDQILQRPLRSALKEHRDQPAQLVKLLSTIVQIAEHSELIRELFVSGELFSPLKFSLAEAHTFLKEVFLYEKYGVICRIPDWWHSRNNTFIKVSISNNQHQELSIHTRLNIKPQIYVGNLLLSYADASDLLAEANELAFIKEKWIAVDTKKLQAVLAAFDQALNIGDVTLYEALKLQLGLSSIVSKQLVDVMEVDNGPWLKNLQSSSLAAHNLDDIRPTAEFTGQLRPYQQAGFSWLFSMRKLGLGALLADDMGLGKTIQTLALLDYLRVHEPVKTLLIVPASLLGNWQSELEQFAPKISYKLLHGSQKDLGLLLDIYFDVRDLFITTYNMVPRIMNDLKELDWDLIIIDEAQYIKNHNAQHSKALKAIPAKFRLAITGTPLENNLTELWSIFEFLNQGLLGSNSHFSNVVKTLSSRLDNYASLHKVINPFILRRVKSDKSIIADLPDKIEITAFTELSRKQIALYTAVANSVAESIKNKTSMPPENIVLTALIKFKKICNHPDHFLGRGDFNPKQSGKFMRLKELCENIAEKREKVIIFTQFREMCQPLVNFLNEVFGRPGLTLHGKIPIKNRLEIVNKFNTDESIPFMVLSLRTGGVGLNLTAANHVIHFDRWWNPAVENQATDRAFRIGQTKNVLVHKFVTQGTIEDKIHTLLIEKQKMAGNIIVANGEKWIFDLSELELIKLFQLEV